MRFVGAAGAVLVNLSDSPSSLGLKRCCTKQRRPAAPIDPALKKAKHVRLPSQDLPPAVPVFVPGPAGPVLVAEGKHVRRKEQEVPRELPAALQAGSR